MELVVNAMVDIQKPFIEWEYKEGARQKATGKAEIGNVKHTRVMMLSDLLKREKDAILERWFNLILETYPADAAALMKKDKNPFTNPVGSTISREIEALFEGLLEKGDPRNFQLLWMPFLRSDRFKTLLLRRQLDSFFY